MKAVLHEIDVNIKLKIKDTLRKTGPGPFTKAINNTLSTIFNHGVIVLSGDTFACCGGYSNSKIATNATLVKHGFKGSWKH